MTDHKRIASRKSYDTSRQMNSTLRAHGDNLPVMYEADDPDRVLFLRVGDAWLTADEVTEISDRMREQQAWLVEALS